MKDKTNYVKRTQKDYLSFKHQVVFEVESGQESTTHSDRITRVFTEPLSKCIDKMKYKLGLVKKLEKRSRLLFSN